MKEGQWARRLRSYTRASDDAQRTESEHGVHLLPVVQDQPLAGHAFNHISLHDPQAKSIPVAPASAGSTAVLSEAAPSPAESTDRQAVARAATDSLFADPLVQRQVSPAPAAGVSVPSPPAPPSLSPPPEQHDPLSLYRWNVQNHNWDAAALDLRHFAGAELAARIAEVLPEGLDPLKQASDHLEDQATVPIRVTILDRQFSEAAQADPPRWSEALQALIGFNRSDLIERFLRLSPPQRAALVQTAFAQRQDELASTLRGADPAYLHTPWPTDTHSWEGLDLYDLAEENLPTDTFAYGPHSSSHIVQEAGIYQLVPQLRDQADPHVVYYAAYSTRWKKTSFAVGPSRLDEFVQHWFLYMTLAGNYYGLGGRPPEPAVQQAILAWRAGANEDMQRACAHLKGVGQETLANPEWWLRMAANAALGAVGGGVGERGVVIEGTLEESPALMPHPEELEGTVIEPHAPQLPAGAPPQLPSPSQHPQLPAASQSVLPAPSTSPVEISAAPVSQSSALIPVHEETLPGPVQQAANTNASFLDMPPANDTTPLPPGPEGNVVALPVPGENEVPLAAGAEGRTPGLLQRPAMPGGRHFYASNSGSGGSGGGDGPPTGPDTPASTSSSETSAITPVSEMSPSEAITPASGTEAGGFSQLHYYQSMKPEQKRFVRDLIRLRRSDLFWQMIEGMTYREEFLKLSMGKWRAYFQEYEVAAPERRIRLDQIKTLEQRAFYSQQLGHLEFRKFFYGLDDAQWNALREMDTDQWRFLYKLYARGAVPPVMPGTPAPIHFRPREDLAFWKMYFDLSEPQQALFISETDTKQWRSWLTTYSESTPEDRAILVDIDPHLWTVYNRVLHLDKELRLKPKDPDLDNVRVTIRDIITSLRGFHAGLKEFGDFTQFNALLQEIAPALAARGSGTDKLNRLVAALRASGPRSRIVLENPPSTVSLPETESPAPVPGQWQGTITVKQPGGDPSLPQLPPGPQPSSRLAPPRPMLRLPGSQLPQLPPASPITGPVEPPDTIPASTTPTEQTASMPPTQRATTEQAGTTPAATAGAVPGRYYTVYRNLSDKRPALNLFLRTSVSPEQWELLARVSFDKRLFILDLGPRWDAFWQMQAVIRERWEDIFISDEMTPLNWKACLDVYAQFRKDTEVLRDIDPSLWQRYSNLPRYLQLAMRELNQDQRNLFVRQAGERPEERERLLAELLKSRGTSPAAGDQLGQAGPAFRVGELVPELRRVYLNECRQHSHLAQFLADNTTAQQWEVLRTMLPDQWHLFLALTSQFRAKWEWDLIWEMYARVPEDPRQRAAFLYGMHPGEWQSCLRIYTNATPDEQDILKDAEDPRLWRRYPVLIRRHPEAREALKSMNHNERHLLLLEETADGRALSLQEKKQRMSEGAWKMILALPRHQEVFLAMTSGDLNACYKVYSSLSPVEQGLAAELSDPYLLLDMETQEGRNRHLGEISRSQLTLAVPEQEDILEHMDPGDVLACYKLYEDLLSLEQEVLRDIDSHLWIRYPDLTPAHKRALVQMTTWQRDQFMRLESEAERTEFLQEQGLPEQ